jgi:hypothetical protein
MSGGAYEYKYYVLSEYYEGKMYDTELNGMIKDLANLLYELEWWRSGDTNERDYRKCVRDFKAKWMHQSEDDVRDKYIAALQEKCDELKEELRWI